MRVSRRARVHEDRGGDPLDGLVNLFDLGIVLAVAFLIAALSSVDLTEVITDQAAVQDAQTGNVTATEDEVANEIQLAPGERVVGNGEAIGTVYQLDDGRTVIVRPGESAPVPGEGDSALPDDGSTDPLDPNATAPEQGLDDLGLPEDPATAP